MTHPVTVAASILAADFGAMHEQITLLDSSGTDWFHVDIMDGHFVPPISFGDQMIATAKKATAKPLDVHLMVENPEQHFESFKKAGASALTVHQETCPHLHKTLSTVRELGLLAGVAINPGTSVETIHDVLGICDIVLVMTVNPGFGGQKFIPEIVGKIQTLSEQRQKEQLNFKISVDGGINSETAKICRGAGASIFVAGTYLFASTNKKSAIQSLRN